MESRVGVSQAEERYWDAELDSTRVRRPPSAAAATAACQAADDDAEERDDGVDDRLKTSGDGVDNGHDAVSDGAELEWNVSLGSLRWRVEERTYD